MKLAVLVLILIALGGALFAEQSYVSVKDRFNWLYETDMIDEVQVSELNWTPEFSLQVPLSDVYRLQAEYSMQARANSIWQDSQQEGNISLKSYRYWVRVSTAQSELRVGLQRLSFGTAQVLRPLMWFDQINPTDESEETRGVTAILARHYLSNNGSLWAWGILSDGRIKGNELIGSEDNSIEFGGRISYPIGNQDIGVVFHQRKLRAELAGQKATEQRLGMDFRADWAFGLWLESSVSHFSKAAMLPYENSVTTSLGIDYTISAGNGLYLLWENLISHAGGEQVSSLRNRDALAAIMMDYPLGLLDKVTLLNIYDYKAQKSLHTVIFRRAYDYLGFELRFASDFGQKFANRGVRQIYAGITLNI